MAILFSGGKDSCLATWYALHQGWDVLTLLSAQPASSDSWMFHFPTVEWTKLQAQASGIPITMFRPALTRQEELDDLNRAISKLKQKGAEGVISGAVASDYQRKRLDRICDELMLPSFAPLWRKDPAFLLDELLMLGFEVYITAVAAMGLDGSWLGRKLDRRAIDELLGLSRKYGFHLAGEGGEYETFVADAPFFQRRVQIERLSKRTRNGSDYIVIESASLADKI